MGVEAGRKKAVAWLRATATRKARTNPFCVDMVADMRSGSLYTRKKNEWGRELSHWWVDGVVKPKDRGDASYPARLQPQTTTRAGFDLYSSQNLSLPHAMTLHAKRTEGFISGYNGELSSSYLQL